MCWGDFPAVLWSYLFHQCKTEKSEIEHGLAVVVIKVGLKYLNCLPHGSELKAKKWARKIFFLPI